MTSFYYNYHNALRIFSLVQIFIPLSRIVKQLPLIIWQKKKNRQSIQVVVVFDAIVQMTCF